MMSSYQSYAEYYHDQTKYTPEGIASSQHRLDFNNQPTPFKEYLNKKNIDLSYLLPIERNPFSDIGIKNPKEFTEEEKSLAKLSQLLYFSDGITAMIPYNDKPFYMRSSPSAGGLYPTEIYVLANSYKGLENGVYNYQAINHGLTLIQKGDFREKLTEATFNHLLINGKSEIISPLQLIFTGVFYRSSWRYQDRAYRRICLDTGHVLGNTDLMSFPSGFKAVLIGGFNDKAVNEILSLDEDEEQVLAIVALADKESCTGRLEACPPPALPSKLDNQNIKTPEGTRLLQLHNRSKIEKFVDVPNINLPDVEEKFQFSPKILLEENTDKEHTLGRLSWHESLLPTILKRRSTRAFSGEPIMKEELNTILDFAYHPEQFYAEGLDPSPMYFDLSLIETFIAVNDIDGLEEGCYYYSKKGKYLRQVRFKNFREEVYYLCLGQELGYKASAVIFHTCDLSKSIFKYGERAYRYIHMDAGHLGQRINLAAINLKLGVSGIGGFFDDNVNEVLGIPEDEAVVYITTLGVPAKAAE